MFITTKQIKLDKSQKVGWLTAGVNLSPANEASLVLNRPDLGSVCPKAGACKDVCLKFTGMNQMPTHHLARAGRTAQLLDHWPLTVAQIRAELESQYIRAQLKGFKFAARPNLLSDLPRLATELAGALPHIQFYDYTKISKPWTRTKPNYHLTFSYSERSNWAEVEECLAHKINVAIVFDRQKDDELPTEYRDWPVIDGDEHDLRFLDQTPAIVGLRFKGSRARLAQGLAEGFVVKL